MKNCIVLISLLALGFTVRATDPITTKSSITEVTVFSQGAQLYHTASYSIKPGITEIHIEGISAFIDAKSIQLQATGNSVILDTRYRLFYPQPDSKKTDANLSKSKKDLEAIQDSIELILYDIMELEDEINVLNAAKNIITNNGAVRGNGKVNDSINLLKQTVEYYASKMNEINKRILSLEKKKKEKSKIKQRLSQRYSELQTFINQNTNPNASQQGIPQIIVTLSTSENTTGKIYLSYLVSSAGWTPIYDIRSDSKTGKISLTYKAQVFQSCGLDWENIKLNISTNNPFVNKTKPTLNPWYVDYQAYRHKTLNEVDLKAARQIPQAAYNQGFMLKDKMEDLPPAMDADQFTTVVHQLIAAEFKIDLPYSIKSNNEKVMVLIKKQDLNTTFKYFAVPKLDPGVYLVAQMTKIDELQLIPASANIFFDGSYIGETYIDPTNIDDTLNLSLGKDPNIVTKRNLLKQKSKDKIVQDKRERTFMYQLEIQNNKSTEIQIVVQDQYPITTQSEIQIELTEKSNAKEISGKGILEWEYSMKPGENRKMEFGYKVKHPKDQPITLDL
jgi:uncharacterized protein (TIGR02231 family)